MVRQSWIEDLLHFLVLREIGRNLATALVVLLHANSKRLDAAQDQPAFKRRENAARALLHEGKLLFVLRLCTNEHAAQVHRCGR